MKKHTPTPWKVVPPMHGHPTEYQCVQIGADERYTTLEMEPADAAFIVTACNSFAAMREALEEILKHSVVACVCEFAGGKKCHMCNAYAALAIANGKDGEK